MIYSLGLTCEDRQSTLSGEVPLARSIQQIHLVRLSSDVKQLSVEVFSGRFIILFKIFTQESQKDVGFAHFGRAKHHYSLTVLRLGETQLHSIHGFFRELFIRHLPMARTRSAR